MTLSDNNVTPPSAPHDGAPPPSVSQAPFEYTLWSDLFTTTGTLVQSTWQGVYELVSQPVKNIKRAEDKHLAGGWSPGSFRTITDIDKKTGQPKINKKTGSPKEKTRSKETALLLYGAGLDYECKHPDLAATTIEQAENLFEGLAYVLHTTYQHSPDRHRFRMVFLFSRPCTGPEHEIVTEWLQKQSLDAGHHLDKKAKDCSRLWFRPATAPGQEENFVAKLVEGAPLDVDGILATASHPVDSPQVAINQTEISISSAERYFKAAFESARQNILVCPHGNRNNLLAKEAYSLGGLASQAGISLDNLIADLLDVVSQAHWTPISWPNVTGTIRRQVHEGAARPRQIPPPKQSPKPPQDTANRSAGRVASPPVLHQPVQPQASAFAISPPDITVSDQWKSDLKYNKQGYISSLANLLCVLMNDQRWHGKIAFNEFDEEIHFLAPPPFAHAYAGDHGTAKQYPAELQEVDGVRLAAWFEVEYNMRFTKEQVFTGLEVVARQHSFHPIKQYLLSLEWDGIPRIKTLFSDLGVGSGDRYTQLVTQWWFISAVARVFDPGCKADCMLVLEGSTGLKKSSFLKILSLNPEAWFTDHMPPLDSKDARAHIKGRWIIEDQELESCGKAGLNALKSFLSITHDRYRPAYARKAVNVPRQCVFAATVNPDGAGYLRDPTGNRRFHPVTITSPIDLAQVKQIAEQLWAEAVTLYQWGSRWYPETDEEKKLCERQQEERLVVDVWETNISRWLQQKKCARPGSTDPADWWPTHVGEVCQQALGIETSKMTRSEQTRVGQTLAKLGWVKGERANVDGTRIYPWWPPKTTTEYINSVDAQRALCDAFTVKLWSKHTVASELPTLPTGGRSVNCVQMP